MFRKYEKTFRLQVPQFEVPGKLSLSKDDAKELFAAEVIVEEKLDGANTGIIRHKSGFHLQKRGSLVGTSEHAQFQFFHGWANNQKYDQIMSLPKGVILYGELLYAVHTIYYDRLPDYWLCFEVWNGERYLDRDEKEDFCAKHGFLTVPLIARGMYDSATVAKLMPEQSAFGEKAEGIVIKRYRKKHCERLVAKLVKAEFIKEIEESDHWIHQAFKKNRLGGSNV